MPRLVVTSDWHGDAITAGLNRFGDVSAGADAVVEAAKGADAFFFLGDLSDPDNIRSHRAVAFAVRIATRLEQEKIPSLWLTGNHDVIEDGHGTHTLSALKELTGARCPSVSVVDSPSYGYHRPVDAFVVCFPFVARNQSYDPGDHLLEAVAYYAEHGQKRRVIVVSHLNCEGAGVGSESRTMARGRESYLPLEGIGNHFPGALVLNGHYHKRQSFELHGVEIHIPGSLERLRFDEEHDPCGWLEVTW